MKLEDLKKKAVGDQLVSDLAVDKLKKQDIINLFKN
jgi:hypothetical protein